MKSLTVLAALLAMQAATPVYAEAPFVDPASDADHFGPADKFLFWTPEQQVAGYRNTDSIFPTRRIAATGDALELPEAPIDLGAVTISAGALAGQ